jgi:hypothetical protein
MKKAPGIATNPSRPSASCPTQNVDEGLDGITDLPNSGTSNGRRSHRCYPVDFGIRCRRLETDRVLLGRIRDISTGGVRFTSSEILAPGTKVELSIGWPSLLDHACRLQLKCRGRVLRSDAHGTAVKMEGHEFYTRKTHATGRGCAVAAGT